jgi:hypothetical protein
MYSGRAEAAGWAFGGSIYVYRYVYGLVDTGKKKYIS